jgi:hypothetical protein
LLDPRLSLAQKRVTAVMPLRRKLPAHHHRTQLTGQQRRELSQQSKLGGL